jgi:hypothetical protein
MNKALPVKNRAAVEAWAQAVVRQLPGVIEVAAPPKGSRADAVVRFEGHRRPVMVEVKRHLDAVTAHAVLSHVAEGQKDPCLVVAETTTAGARDLLEARGIGYIDAAGNASIRMPGLLVRTGSFTASAVIAPKTPRSAVRLSGKSGLVAQTLLLGSGRAWTITDLASEAGVSAGLTHRVLGRLETMRLVATEGRGPAKVRRVVAPAALLDLWAEEDAEPRARLSNCFLLAKPGAVLAAAASERLSAAGLEHAITGVAAASLSAPTLTTVPVTQVRVTASLPREAVFEALDARPADEGFNVQVTQGADDLELRLRREQGGVWVAAATRIYLDALRDPRRGREQAAAFRTAVLRM